MRKECKIFFFIGIILISLLCIDCQKDNQHLEKKEIDSASVINEKPLVESIIVKDVSKQEALIIGKVIEDGGQTVRSRGVCWSLNPNPTIEDNKAGANVVSGSGLFQTLITGLKPGIKYYAKAYASNREGIGYGETLVFVTDSIVPVDSSALSAYLFVYFTGNGWGQEAIHYAVSKDGFHYTALNDDNPILSADTISNSGGVRDPHILRGVDSETFYMVATDMHVAENGWTGNKGLVLMKSKDLIHWTHRALIIPNVFPELEQDGEKINRVWAPQTIYDAAKDKYMVYWAMRMGNGTDKIYYSYANEAFTKLTTTPKQLFFSPTGVSCIDADIVRKDEKYHLFFKTESTRKKGIKSAESTHLTQGYHIANDNYLQSTDKPVEGSCVFKLNNSETWILMYDMYTSGQYQFTTSEDLVHFKIHEDIFMDFHPRHGTVMGISLREAERLIVQWGLKNAAYFK